MASELTYVQPDKPTRPFRAGDTVETMDRDGKAMGTYTVIRATKKLVTTDCHRRWTQEGYWWDGVRGWPFPWIRLQK